MNQYIRIRELSKKEKTEILEWGKEKDLWFFEDSPSGIERILKSYDIKILESNKRVPLIYGNESRKMLSWYSIRKGNLFEFIKKDLIRGVLKGAYLRGGTVTEIFSEGDVFQIIPGQFSPTQNLEHIITGLPWDKGDKTFPVEVVKLVLLDATDITLPFTTITSNDIFLRKQIHFYKLRICSLLKDARAKLAYVLYLCFLGQVPLQWWKKLKKEKEEGQKENKLTDLRKPLEPIIEFIISEDQLAILTGLTQKHFINVLPMDKRESDSVYSFIEYLKIKKSGKMYEFSLQSTPDKFCPASFKNRSGMITSFYTELLDELKTSFISP